MLKRTIEAIKSVEAQYSDRCKNGSKDPEDFLQMNYYSGLYNGFNFAVYLQENEVTEEEYKMMLNDLLHLEKPS